MNRITWTPQLATGHDRIDSQHQHLLKILEHLAMRTDAGVVLAPAELDGVVGELGDYAREHFDTEVQLMLDKKCDLRHVQKHVREHEGFIRHISLVREALDEKRHDEGAELARYLGEWFARHIAGSDLIMARQVSRIDAGETPEAAFSAEQPRLARVA